MTHAYVDDSDELLLDWNESPLGPPPVSVRRIAEAAGSLGERPWGLARSVRKLAAQEIGVAPGQLLLVNGVDEAIDLAMTVARRGFGLTPGFDFWSRIASCGRPYTAIPLGPRWQPAGVPAGLGPGDALFVAQPGNPTGILTGEGWIARCRDTGCYYFRDETYQAFCSVPSALPQALDGGRTLVYRSFAKSHGLGGLRVGCLIGDAELIARLGLARDRLPLESVHLHAAAAALEEPGFTVELAAFVRRQRPLLARRLRESGLFTEVRDTETNFVIGRPARGPADVLVDALARLGVRIKSCDYFGLPDWVRIGVPSEDGLARLVRALDQVASADAALAPAMTARLRFWWIAYFWACRRGRRGAWHLGGRRIPGSADPVSRAWTFRG